MTRGPKLNINNLLIFFSSTLIYAFCQMLFSIILMKEDPWHNFHKQISAHYIVILAMCIGDYGLLMLLNRYLPYSNKILYRIVAGVTGLAVICFFLLSIFDYLIYNVMDVSQEGMPSFLTKFALGMAANVPILLVFELIYYLRSEQKAIADSEKLKRKALLYQHDTLRAQINPHFLFNSLNVLSSLIYINQDNANKFTKALSKTYRYVLSLNQHPMISLAEELEALNSYIFMMKMRFQNSFTFVIKKLAVCEDNMIVPLTLQLLIENAFKHNIATETQPLDVQIIIDNDYITVKNNIQPSNNVDNSGIGLKYLTEHYQLYSKAVVVEHGSQTFIVKVPYIE